MDYSLNPEARTEQRDAQSKEELRKRRDELNDILFLMNDPAGRRVANRLLVKAGVWRTTFVGGHPDQTAFNEGNRNMGLWLLGEIMEIAPAQYAQMIEEA